MLQTTESQYKGSTNTFKMVYQQILERWGAKEAAKYDPYKNCFTFKKWLSMGYSVKKGEKALRSVTFISNDEVDVQGTVVQQGRSYPKTVCLFYKLQVKKRKVT